MVPNAPQQESDSLLQLSDAKDGGVALHEFDNPEADQGVLILHRQQVVLVLGCKAGEFLLEVVPSQDWLADDAQDQVVVSQPGVCRTAIQRIQLLLGVAVLGLVQVQLADSREGSAKQLRHGSVDVPAELHK